MTLDPMQNQTGTFLQTNGGQRILHLWRVDGRLAYIRPGVAGVTIYTRNGSQTISRARWEAFKAEADVDHVPVTDRYSLGQFDAARRCRIPYSQFVDAVEHHHAGAVAA